MKGAPFRIEPYVFKPRDSESERAFRTGMAGIVAFFLLGMGAGFLIVGVVQ